MIYEIKKAAQDMKEEFITDTDNIRRKNETKILEKKSFKSIENKLIPLQQTRTSGTQNVKAKRQNRF
jgi:hypothetical protein